MVKQVPRLLCLYDGDCGFCALCVRIVQRLDHRHRIEFVANREVDRWPHGVTQGLVDSTIVVAEQERPGFATRAAAVASLLRALPCGALLSFLLGLPGIAPLANRAYDLVARNRLRVSAALGMGVCGAGDRPSENPESRRTVVREGSGQE